LIYAGKDNFAFGAPTRYLILDPKHCSSPQLADTNSSSTPSSSSLSPTNVWDRGIEDGDEMYRHRMHNLCCDNCHSHVSACLNAMGYGGWRHYGMVQIAIWMFVCGRFVDTCAAVKSLGPAAIIVLLIVLWRTGCF
jgi:hypothetical protein